jgi:hypothetical protein
MDMPWHPTEDELILHAYRRRDGQRRTDDRGEGARTDDIGIDTHLAACAACRAAWDELRATLELVDAATVPEPGLGFEQVMWARIERTLPAKRTSRWSLRQLVPLAGLTAVVAAVVLAGYAWRGTTNTPASSRTRAVTSPRDVQRTRERVLLTALNDHFEQTQMLLVELLNAPDTARSDLQFERATAGDLVASGRLYRVTARQTGDLQFAQMLEDLESVLVEVARGPDTMSPDDLKSLRTRIQNEGLLFKVRAVTNEIHDRQRDFWTSTE